MKKKIITNSIFCFFCGVLSSNISAQEYKTYDLNKYYTPDIVRRGLDLNFYTNGSFSTENLQNAGDTINSNNLSGQLNSSFFTFKNTRKNESLLQLNLGLFGQFNNSSEKPINYYSPNSHFLNSAENIGLSYTNKSYNSAKQFLSFGVTTRLGYSSGSNKTKNIYSIEKTTTDNIFNFAIAPYVGVGFGRIEAVTDARQAIYILDDLSKRGILTHQLSNDEIFRFSQQISQVKNKRFLDARLHKINEISTVDSFLVNNHLLTKSDATYFTTLYDNWENGANFERKSGHVFEIQLSPSANWYNTKNQTDTLNRSSIWNKQRNNDYGISLAFNYEYAKQMNLNWERTASASLLGSASHVGSFYSTEAIDEYSNKQNVGIIALNGSYSIGYYPNTRTHLSAKLSQHLAQSFYDKVSYNSWQNYFNSTTDLSFSAVYYVSSQLSLSGDASVYNNYEKITYSSANNKNNKLGAGFSASLKYSFF